MAGDKFCPIQSQQGMPPHQFFCDKEKCAWWHVLNIQTKRGRCSILSIAVANHWISVNPKHHIFEVKNA